MRITVLGSGTSHGVPVLGCSCPVCTSADEKDKRMRSSLLVEGRAGESAVIDTGPEFRLQALRAGLRRLDAVFLTHCHADHLHGLDDVRPLSREKRIPVYGSETAIEELLERFAYIFKDTQRGGGKPNIEPRRAEAGNEVKTGNLSFIPIPVRHGELNIFGWKIREAGSGQSAVYLTDTSHIGDNSFSLIAKGGGPALLVIGALRKRPHSTHFSFDEAAEAAGRIGANATYFTHICHDHLHREIEEHCREYAETGQYTKRIAPAWDGLCAEL